MLTEEEIEKRFNIVKETYNKLKEHPYWLNPDDTLLLKNVLQLFRVISNNYWGISNNTNPYYAIIRCCTHDFNCMIYNISESIKTKSFKDEWKDCMGDVNMVLQVYLQNIYNIIDNYSPSEDEDIIGYTYHKWDSIKNDIAKFQAFKKDNGEYIVYRILGKDSIPAIKKYFKKYLGLPDGKPMKTWSINCLKEIEDKKDIIGGIYKIV